MIERLQNIENRYNELTEQLMKPEVISNINETLKLTKEQAGLRECYEAFQEYKRLEKNIIEAKEMLKDSLPLETIKKYTGLSLKKLQELKLLI